MHGIAATRARHALATVAWAIVNAPLRLLSTQPASPWLPVLFYVPLAVAAALWNLLDGPVAAWSFLVLPLAGLLLWTLLEYVIHAVGFHRPTRWPRLLTLQASHGSHHEDPTDPMRIVAHLSTSLPVALAMFAVLSLALQDVKRAALVLVGVLIGYLAYEVVHYRIHLGRKSRWLPRALVRHHLYHHHKDPSRCYGVTTPLWDWVCRTNRPSPRRANQGPTLRVATGQQASRDG